MKDLSLHILDIVQNSTRAKATLIEIGVLYNEPGDFLKISIVDNGVGMPPELVQRVLDPFATTRTTRKVGLGLPLLQQSSKQGGGCLTIESQEGVGTKVVASFQISNIDTPPLGDLAGVITLLLTGNPNVDFVFCFESPLGLYQLDSRDIKETLDGISISDAAVVRFIKEMIHENIEVLRGNL